MNHIEFVNKQALAMWLVVVMASVIGGIKSAQSQPQKLLQRHEVHTMTAYSYGDGLTPSRTMASGKKIFVGACACSSRYPFGTVFYWQEGNMTFVCFDRGGNRIERWNWVDIYVPFPKDADNFGIKRGQHFVVVIPKKKYKNYK